MVSFHGLQTFHINWSLPVTGGIVNALFLGFLLMLEFLVLKAHRILLKNKNKGVS
jgi:hypothetical protein